MNCIAIALVMSCGGTPRRDPETEPTGSLFTENGLYTTAAGMSDTKDTLAGGYRVSIGKSPAHYLVSVTTDTETSSIMMITVK